MPAGEHSNSGKSAFVDVAHRRAKALEMIRGIRFDAAVIDIRAGVLLLSEWASDTTVVEVARQGATEVLGEPVDVVHIEELLGHALRQGVIALVDDDDALTEKLAEALRERGFSPVATHSAREVRWLVMARPLGAATEARTDPRDRRGADLVQVGWPT
jgi:ActR/RegA family two-component response regulator